MLCRVLLAGAILAGLAHAQNTTLLAPVEPAPPTAAEAAAFMAELEVDLLDLWIARERASWVKSTHITEDTDILAARAEEAVMAFVSAKAADARRFQGLPLDPVLARKFNLLRLSLSLPAPADPVRRQRLAQIASELTSAYGKGKVCPAPDDCSTLADLSRVLATSRDPEALRTAWVGWRSATRAMRERYVEFVELANAGAREFGFNDMGELWRSKYDMSPAEFEDELTRLWDQVRPLYEQLHCYVRNRLREQYGSDVVSATGPIPAHLLGNMWSQEWNNLFDLVAPEKGTAYDLTAILEAKGLSEIDVVRQAEAFFVSLGLDPLPESFWQRSMFVKPPDREVVCHASAWDIDWRDDLRIKMCIELTAEDFVTIHHELGHNYYQRAYKHQPTLFTDSANDGFHEAIGDTIALSVTPSYLVKIGYLDTLPPDNLNPLMQRALDKIAFLPFGLVVDKWRFDVFAGRVPPQQYNQHWWQLRTQYQGIVPPVPRSESDFDPASKYHVAANVPYTRYFLATILQFQFHRALCEIAGHEGPLHTCSVYGNQEVGRRLEAMLAMGLSRPWPEALEALTGETRMDASAIIDYFQPLREWLEAQNANATCGW